MNDMTVIKSEPNRETSQRGMLSKRPAPSIAFMMSLGKVAAVEMELPSPLIAVCTIPPHISKMAVMISMHLPTAVLARIKRIKCRNTNSGL